MSEPETFVARWSRLKRQAEDGRRPPSLRTRRRAVQPATASDGRS